jgi:hypothetical protein
VLTRGRLAALGRALGLASERFAAAVLAVIVGVVVLVVLGTGGLAWRLSRGPLDVSAVAHWLEASFAPDVSTGTVSLAIERVAGLRVLQVQVTNVQRDATGGQGAQSVRSATLVLGLGKLLSGQLAPETVTADGLRLTITRPATGPSDTDKGLDLRPLADLQHVAITDMQVAIHDEAMGLHWQIADASVDIQRQPDTSLLSHAGGTVQIGGLSGRLDLAGRYDTKTGGTIRASLSPVSPAALAKAVPALAAASVFDAPVSLEANATLGTDLALRHVNLHATAGAGTMDLPAKGGGTSAAHFTAISLDAEGDTHAAKLNALRITLTPPSGNPASTLTLSGTADFGPGRIRAVVAVDLDQAAFSDLPSFWPDRVGGGARPWLTENITGGTAHDGHFTATIEGTSLDDLKITQSGGSLTGDDITLWWLKPVPPIEHGHAVLTWENPDTVLITVNAGRTGNIQVRGGTMRITGMLVHDQDSVINADLGGPLKEVLALLSNPRLKLLSERPINFTNPSGMVAAHLAIQLPLETKVTIDQIGIHASGRVTDVHLGAIAAGRDLDRGQIALDITNNGLKAAGAGFLDHLPTTLQVDMDFRDGPPTQVIQHVAATARITPVDAQAAGIGGVGLSGGVIPVNVDYAEQRGGTSTLMVNADLQPAAFDTPLGWSKMVGTPGHAEGRASIVHGKLTTLDGIKIEAPGLLVQARSELSGGKLTAVQIEHGDIGKTSITGSIGLPQRDGDPYRIALSGPRLDLEGRLSQSKPASSTPAAPPTATSPAATPSEPGMPYTLDLRFARVMFGADRALGPVTVTAAGDGRHLTSGHLISGGADKTRADLVPVPGGRRLTATAASLGTLLHETNLASEVTGGALTLNAEFQDRQPGSPLVGNAELDNFTVRGAPIMGKILQGMTLYGLVDALSGPGLVFDRMTTGFRLHGGTVELQEASAYSSSLGITTTGRLDFDRQQVDLTGTIVPAYFFNSLPGRVPLVGRLFSPEKGSGVFAANFSLRGPVSNPSVSVNPLSALTPGLLRRLFNLFD